MPSAGYRSHEIRGHLSSLHHHRRCGGGTTTAHATVGRRTSVQMDADKPSKKARLREARAQLKESLQPNVRWLAEWRSSRPASLDGSLGSARRR